MVLGTVREVREFGEVKLLKLSNLPPLSLKLKEAD